MSMEPISITQEFRESRLPLAEAARRLGIAPSTLRHKCAAGVGPRFIRSGKKHSRLYFKLSSLLEYLNAQEEIEPSVEKNAEAAYVNKKTA